jgi:phosphoribosylanthranilate isomerase
MRVKICGLTRMQDAFLARDLGAWALGFVFAPKSKRRVAPEIAREIVVETHARCVGVFVDQTDELLSMIPDIPFAGVQLHGKETPDDCRRVRGNFGGFIVKALRMEKEDDLSVIESYRDCVDYILVDSCVNGAFGGTGVTGDWDLAARAAGFGVPLILAGGLNAGNILEAAARVPFFAADLCGGVESAYGVKDEGKMRELFAKMEKMT